MKRITFYSLVTAIALTLSACGAQPVPTMSAVDVQNTAIAAAFTMVAQTQESLPTNTPVPPTDTPTQTPPATNTPLPLPSLQVSPTAAVAAATSGGDPCATRVLSWSPKGKETIIRIVNTTKATVNVSLYLNETASAGECGYRAYTLTKLADVVITDLVQGCYNLWAWGDSKGIHVNSSGYGCLNNSDKWTFEISENTIKFTQ